MLPEQGFASYSLKILFLKIIYVLKGTNQQVNKTLWFAQVTHKKISPQKLQKVLPNSLAKKEFGYVKIDTINNKK